MKRKLPSMYHQFLELADVDITKQAMEVGPTTHYPPGGIRVDPDTGAATVPGLFAAGEWPPAYGANRLRGNSLSDLVVFGRLAGLGAAQFAREARAMPRITDAGPRRRGPRAAGPFERAGGDNPYDIHRDLQRCMDVQVGIFRVREGLELALSSLRDLARRAAGARAVGGRVFNPGWHLARPAKHAVGRRRHRPLGADAAGESRRALALDYEPRPQFGQVDHAAVLANGELQVRPTPLPACRPSSRRCSKRRRRKGRMTPGRNARRPRRPPPARRRPRAGQAHDARHALIVRVFRGDPSGGTGVDYEVPIEPGMALVLDAIHWIRTPRPRPRRALELQAAKCGSCSAPR